MLNWVNRFNIFCFLDNNNYTFEQPAFEWMLAAGCKEDVTLNENQSITALKQFSEQHKDWVFGHISYPAPGKLAEHCEDKIKFPAAYFFTAVTMVWLQDDIITIESDSEQPEEIYKAILQQPSVVVNVSRSKPGIQKRYSKEEYISIIESIHQHIRRGDCYEINFCQEFYAEDADIDPVYIYHQLSSVSPNPFSALYKLNDRYCLCASPERFIKRSGNEIISQPIKGTAKRNLADAYEDDTNKNSLLLSKKEKSENVMIVDLVRNDMSRICTEGSVHLKELFGIYSFPQVHQMISTIAGTVNDCTHWTSILDACFPMGSMTGAPKLKVMELIDRYEKVPRGLFSGTIGYIQPNGDFDFNVVIRSLFYNESNKFLSFKAGGGITFYSDADAEYEESLLKAKAISDILHKP
ncbi:MAG: anthranilate synthase component I family protein [Bacteroidetes bacterium]|nr:anthranilate synthase component I family protein [Bacteroidota bacterium]